MTPAIELKNLHKSFGKTAIIRGANLAVTRGERVAMIGPNGAGKSTLVQLLSGVVQPDAGRVTFGQTDVTRFSAPQRFSLGMVRTFQTARVFPGLSVLESVLVGAYHGVLYETRRYGLAATVRDATASLFQLPSWKARRDEAERRALETIALFGDRLQPRLGEFAFSLSYANRRRLEIARALASHPRFLMLDEPTAGMNPTETQELASLLAHIRDIRPGLTLMFIEHKMQVVRQMSKRVIVMDAGRVIADGTPEQALNDPRVIDAYLGSGGGAACC